MKNKEQIKPLGIWVTTTERDCDNCGFHIMYGEDETCIFKKGVVKSPLKAIDLECDGWFDTNGCHDYDADNPNVFCDTWHPHCRATSTHRKAWHRTPERARMNDQMWEKLVGPLDQLHL